MRGIFFFSSFSILRSSLCLLIYISDNVLSVVVVRSVRSIRWI